MGAAVEDMMYFSINQLLIFKSITCESSRFSTIVYINKALQQMFVLLTEENKPSGLIYNSNSNHHFVATCSPSLTEECHYVTFIMLSPFYCT